MLEIEEEDGVDDSLGNTVKHRTSKMGLLRSSSSRSSLLPFVFRNQLVGGDCLINLLAVAEFLENVDMAGLGLGDSDKVMRFILNNPSTSIVCVNSSFFF